jgi:hypothetical protein
MQIRTNPQCTICTNNYEENVNHVLLECEAYTNLRNELNSDITTLFCGQNVDADFTGLPPHGKMMFLIGDLVHRSHKISLNIFLVKYQTKTLLRIII